MGNPGTKIKDILELKNRSAVTVGPDEAVLVAIQRLVENDIGALPVCDAKGAVLGIISERDLLKKSAQEKGVIGSTKVRDVMTKEVVVGVPDDDLDYVMSIMSQKGIRHLPVMSEKKLQGMISIRDVIEAQLEKSKAEIRYLSDYFSGSYG